MSQVRLAIWVIQAMEWCVDGPIDYRIGTELAPNRRRIGIELAVIYGAGADDSAWAIEMEICKWHLVTVIAHSGRCLQRLRYRK